MNPDGPDGRNGPATDDSVLLKEITDLAGSPLPEPVFLQELLKRAVPALGASAGAVWMFDDQKRLVLQCEVQLKSTGFLDDPEMRSSFERPFAEVLQGGGVRAHSYELAPSGNGVRKGCVLLGGLQRESGVAGILQLFEGEGAGEPERPNRLRALEQICSQVARYCQQRKAGAQRAEQPAPSTGIEDSWLLAIHESLRANEVAMVAANECRRLLGVDRVGIAERYGPRAKLRAVSGQQSVNARSNVVRLLSKLTEQVLLAGEKLSFTGDTRNLPPQYEKILADYLHESRSRAIVILPVSGPENRDREETKSPAEREELARPKPVGAVIVEQISETPLPPDLDSRLDTIGRHVGLALRNAQAHERIFLVSLWELLGSWRAKLKGRRVAQWAAALAALAAVVLALIFVTWDYRVSGKGKLMPIDRRGIFAPWDGEVFELFVNSGQKVNEGDLLIRMKNDELHAKLLLAKNTLSDKQQEKDAIVATLSDPALLQSAAQEVELRGKQMQLAVEIEGAAQQVKNLSGRVEALSVRAPITGVVATFRIEELLRKRPVKQGELLLEVMDPTGRWRLELDIPENRIGHIIDAQRKKADPNLAVRYVLATATELTYDGTLESLATRSVTSESEGTVVPAFVALAEPTPPDPRIGAEVTAKINCGKKSLGYVLFGDVIEFLRKWFWL